MAHLTRVMPLEFTNPNVKNHSHETNISSNNCANIELLSINNNRRNSSANAENVSTSPLSSLKITDIMRDKSEIKVPCFGFGDTNEVFPAVPYPTEINRDDAVVVLNACKSYGSRKKQRSILDNLCMTVKKGTIYSLLGSSGCGKTTLLTCVVGMKHLNSGKILVFGAKTGTKASGVPGKRVGYMPQDTALYGDFSIKETMAYFGSMYGMNSDEIEKRRQFLMNLLSLPDESRRISTLSGGQKRRVSLAVTLIHSPPLLILDEPTVGVDPLLRHNIWKHLTKLVSDGQTTVIITTHYISEAVSSNTVGVMRGGKLIAEKSPKLLLDQYKTNTLEDAVLKLCYDDENASDLRARSTSSGNIIVKVKNEKVPKPQMNSHNHQTNNQYPIDEMSYTESCRNSFNRVKSLVMKNTFVMIRNIFLVVFVLCLPATQMVVMGFSMGNDPKPIKVGVVNHEFSATSNVSSCNFEVFVPKNECDVEFLSCRYLRTLPADTIHLSTFKTEEEARNEIALGRIRSFIQFPANYSEYMYERSTSGIIVDNDTLHGSFLNVEMDASNAIVTKCLQRIIFESYKTFIQELLESCGFNRELGGIPIKFQNPIYGDYDLQLSEYITAGMIVGIALFFPLISSSITFIWDKKLGTMERARVAGAQTWEIMMSLFITEGTILLLQACLAFLILTSVFHIVIIGSFALAFSLVVLNGFAGLALGLLIASICTEEIQAVLLGLAIIFPNFFLAGSMWPIEGMPIVLQYVSYLMPGSLACEAFRSIVVRGWGITHVNVWTGFASTCAWMVLFCTLTILVHRLKLSNK